MKLASYPIALVFAVALVAPAAAEPCYTTTTNALETPATGVSLNFGPGVYYVVVDACTITPDGCGFSVWLYEEVNGIAGLQRHDDLRSDIRGCSDGTAPDITLF